MAMPDGDTTNAEQAVFRQRVSGIARVLGNRKLSALVATPPSDTRYILGLTNSPSERPLMLLVRPDGTWTLIAPELEMTGLSRLEDGHVLAYSETDDPARMLSELLADANPATAIAVSDEMRASLLLRLQEAVPSAHFLPASPVIRELRMRKSRVERGLLREAGSRADRAFERVVGERFSGRSERDIQGLLRAAIEESGLEPAEWGPIVGSGSNGASPHHEASDRVIRDGDAVVLDFGGQLQGYQADITRTVVVGEVSSEVRRVFDLVRAAQEAAVGAVAAGVTAQVVDAAARDVIHAGGYGAFFVHRTGHGIGLTTHEEPYIVAGNSLPLEVGMAFSIEPGVYVPDRFGVRIEDIVVLEDGGAVRCNEATRDLVVVG